MKIESGKLVDLSPIYNDIKGLRDTLQRVETKVKEPSQSQPLNPQPMDKIKKKLDDISKYALMLDKRIATLEREQKQANESLIEKIKEVVN